MNQVLDGDWKIRLANLRSINDQTALVKAALEDPHEQVRLAAIQRVNQQPLLIEAAKKASDVEIRREAVARVTDQTVLADIARTDEDPGVKYCAARQLDDKNLGEYYAETQYYNEIIRWTLYRIKDKEVLAKVIEHTTNNNLRSLAKRKLAKLSGD